MLKSAPTIFPAGRRADSAASVTAGFVGCSKLTDEAVIAVAKGCPSLTTASFDFCSDLTDVAGVLAFFEGTDARFWPMWID